MGEIFTYAYGCVGRDAVPVCLTRINTGLIAGMNTTLVTRFPGDRVQTVEWLDLRGQCCISLTVLAARPGAVSATLTYPNGRRIEAQRFEGRGWPFPLFLALGPRGGVFRPKSGSIRIELEDGSTIGMIA